MALATAKAASLRPDIKLSQALSGYEAMLSADQKLSYKASPPDPAAVMALTCEINRKNAGRKARRTGARLTSFLNSVKEFTSIVDLVVGSAGNPIAGAVWGTVKTAIQIASGFESYFDSLSTMLMNVGLNSPRFEKYALLYPTSTSLQKELCNYYATVVDLCSKIVLFVRKPVIKQIASALRKPFDDEFGTFQKDLTRLGTAVSEEVSLASRQLQNCDSIEGAQERKESSIFWATGAVFRKETANELGRAKKWRESRVKSRFLRSCSTYNFEATLNQARKKGASTWIFDTQEYQHWRSEMLPSTLLCSGIVGAGKTILCANVVEQLVLNKKSDCSVGYFFCRDDVVTSLSAREIIGSLARQVFEAVTPDNFSNLDPNTGDIRFNAEQLLSHMLLLLPYHRYYILVIDGLDECEHEEVKVLIELLRSLLSSRNHVFKLFWTGRSDFAARVSEHLQAEFRIRISPSNNGPEIQNFIEDALETALEDGRLKLRDPRIIMKIQDALETGAQEMFLWVAFQIHTICAQNTDEDILHSLEDLPRGLPATFRRVLRRLQLSNFASPSLGKKIFEVIAAAQRPLTLNEIAEAISITPGDTVWNRSKLVNDVSKSLESCGSLVVVDEEFSTIHFAHSSVKQHLLSEPTDLDVKEYHIKSSQADRNLGRITVTYLSLDVLGTQMTKASGPSQTHTANVPTHVMKSALPKYDVINRMALAMLRSRRTPVKDPRLDLERSVSRIHAKNTEDVFSFLPYCQEYWLHHTKTIHLDSDQMYELWQHLIVGDANTAEIPWTAEDESDLGELFIEWIAENRHSALASRAIGQFCYSILAHSVSAEGKLQRLLSLPPGLTGGLIAHTSGIYCSEVDDLLERGIYYGNKAVAQLAIREGADVNDKGANSGNAPLHMAVLRGHEAIAKLLLENGADVNLQVGEYGSVLQIAAAINNRESIAKFLLEKGADVNAYGGEYGTALMVAARIDNVRTMRLLLKAGANVNAIVESSKGQGTALIVAVANSNVNAVNILLEAGADVNSRGWGTQSPLQIAAKRGNEHIVRRLLDNGARMGWGYVLLESVQETMHGLGTTEAIASLIHENEERTTLQTAQQLNRPESASLPDFAQSRFPTASRGDNHTG